MPLQQRKVTMAPNKRKEGKKQLAIWIDEETFERFKAACDFFGVTMTDILTAYIERKANEYEVKTGNNGKEDCAEPVLSAADES